jgi:hypothetical protein
VKGVPLPHFEKSSVEACGAEVLVVVVDLSLEVGLVEVVEVVEVLVGGASTDGAD